MKLRRLIVVVLVVMVSFAAFAPSAMAFYRATCTIYKVGVDDVGNYVDLVDTTTPTPKWSNYRKFYLNTTLGNAGLAVLLTAYSMGRSVDVGILGDASAGSLIKFIYIVE